MRVGIAHNSTALVLLLCYPLFAFLGYQLLGIWGCCAGVGVAWLLDRFWPKWASDLTWKDLATAVGNLAAHGMNGSRLHIILRERRLFIHKDQKDSKERTAVLLFRSGWRDLLPPDKLNNIATEHDAELFVEEWAGKDAIFFSPSRGPVGCLEIVRYLICLADGDLHRKTLAQVDGAKRFVWKRYEDTPYPDWPNGST